MDGVSERGPGPDPQTAHAAQRRAGALVRDVRNLEYVLYEHGRDFEHALGPADDRLLDDDAWHALREAATDALETMDALVADDDLWRTFRAGAHLPGRELLERLHAVDLQRLVTQIEGLGYHSPPPPPAEDLVGRMLGQVALALSVHDPKVVVSRGRLERARAAVAADLWRIRRQVEYEPASPVGRSALAVGGRAALSVGLSLVPPVAGAVLGGALAGPPGSIAGIMLSKAAEGAAERLLGLGVGALVERFAPTPPVPPGLVRRLLERPSVDIDHGRLSLHLYGHLDGLFRSLGQIRLGLDGAEPVEDVLAGLGTTPGWTWRLPRDHWDALQDGLATARRHTRRLENLLSDHLADRAVVTIAQRLEMALKALGGFGYDGGPGRDEALARLADAEADARNLRLAVGHVDKPFAT